MLKTSAGTSSRLFGVPVLFCAGLSHSDFGIYGIHEATGKQVDVLTDDDLREGIAEAIEAEGVTIYERA